jgi:hypothetical protein
VKRLVEIRTYKLTPGARAAFHELCDTRSIPMVSKWGMDVVGYGPSLQQGDEYFLIRAFDSLQHLQASEDAFYATPEWRQGPREAIMALIESYIDAIMWLTPEAVEALRVSLR